MKNPDWTDAGRAWELLVSDIGLGRGVSLQIHFDLGADGVTYWAIGNGKYCQGETLVEAAERLISEIGCMTPLELINALSRAKAMVEILERRVKTEVEPLVLDLAKAQWDNPMYEI